MKITIIGTGYVGLVTGACLAEIGVSIRSYCTKSDNVAQFVEQLESSRSKRQHLSISLAIGPDRVKEAPDIGI